MDLYTSQFDYHLPPERIAHTPTNRREGSRLMVVERASGSIRHDRFQSFPMYLNSPDILVANRSKVIPARIPARRSTGGAAEILILRQRGGSLWTALVRPSKRVRVGNVLQVSGSSMVAILEEEYGEGQWLVRFAGVEEPDHELRRVGTIPLPPYIQNAQSPLDRYQTVYADREGSIAAPTAGLHFSPEVISNIGARRVDMQFVTLHVGVGTFRPVTVERIQDHVMHPEWGEVPQNVASAVNEARASEGKVVAVGTTTTRLLESACTDGRVAAYSGETQMFIYPGYRFRTVDAMLTNFHLPRSTLLMMISAFAGRELVLEAYHEAIREEYRFYSFGDAMLIL